MAFNENIEFGSVSSSDSIHPEKDVIHKHKAIIQMRERLNFCFICDHLDINNQKTYS